MLTRASLVHRLSSKHHNALIVSSLSYKLRCPPAMCSMTDAWQGHHKAMIQIMATQASGADVFVRGATDTMSKILQKKKLICHEALMAAYSSFSQTIFEEG